jgi:uncharacterized membrane protein
MSGVGVAVPLLSAYDSYPDLCWPYLLIDFFSWLDVAAFAWFAMSWITYSLAADLTRLQHRSVANVMNEYRVHWMVAMMQRDLRIIDTSIVANVLHGVAFFTSTAILLVGGLVAGLGASDEAIAVISQLPLGVETSRASWDLKVLFMVAIFIYAFFKLAWSFRLFVNCSILIGAAPLRPVPESVIRDYANCVGHALNLASRHNNAGMRAYFFALAAIWWFLNPLAFLVATSIVVVVLYRREFHSRTLRTIRDGLKISASVDDSVGDSKSSI